MTKVVWNKTAKHLPREGAEVIVCHYMYDESDERMYQTGGYYKNGVWFDMSDEVMYTPKYWTECLEMPE